MRTTRTALALLLAPLLAAPCSGQQPPGGAKPRTSGHTVTTRSQSEHVWMDTGRGLYTRSRGTVVFTPDGRDVARLGPDAYLTLQQSSGGTTRQVEYRPGPSGVERSYQVNGQARPFDAAAKAWAAEFLASVGPKTTVAMGGQLRAALASRGVSGLLDELEQVQNTATRRDFLKEVIETRTLTPAESRRVLRMAAGLPGSSARREVLSAFAARQRPTDEEWAEWFRAAASASSSSDRGALLKVAAAAYPRERALPTAFYGTLDGMSSGADRREVLGALLRQRGSQAREVAQALRSTAKLPSSVDRRDVLRIAAATPGVEGALTEYIETTRTVSSSVDRRDALAALIRGRSLPRAAAVAWLRAAAEIGSDSDKASLLLAAIGRIPDDQATRAAYRDAVETIRSDTHYNRVATAFLRGRAGSR